MSLLAVRIGIGVLALLALLTLRGKRWAYPAFVVLGLLYHPAQAHFQVHAPKCQQVIPTMSVVVLSLQNYALVALFAGFCWMSWVQFRWTRPRVVWAVLATVLAGVLVEVAEGVTGRGVCRVRDLVPAGAGALGAALVLAVWSRLFRKPGYVKIVRRGAAAASRKPVPPRPAPAAPLHGIPTLPVSPRGVVPPPPDFSPTPTSTAPQADVTPTEEVAQNQASVARPELVQRLQAIVQRLVAVLLRFPARFWTVIRGRRRAIIVGGVVLLTLGGAAVGIILLLPAPAPTVVEKPNAPPPPPPKPLQSEAIGYYEPDYQFSIGDRRFTRLTLRPEAFLTFARYTGSQESGCAEARIGQQTVYLRCDVERVGIVTIDGRFTSRFATSRLDAGVLSAVITVRNPRGEVVYRARDSFRWHEPD